MGFGSETLSASQHGVQKRKKNPPRLGAMDKGGPEVPVRLSHVTHERAKHGPAGNHKKESTKPSQSSFRTRENKGNALIPKVDG
eukprot:scaffold3825_cov131-Cylindrotheca_fusiformis.AAC.6